MKRREISVRRGEIKSTLAFVAVILFFLALSLATHTLYFVMINGIGIAVSFIVFSIIYRVLVGESLFQVIAFHIKREMH